MAKKGSGKKPAPEPKRKGRPSKFSQQVADEICDHLAEGRSLRSYCAKDNAPRKSTVMRWLREHATFRDQYAHAREDQAEVLADEMLDISDDGSNDFMMQKRGDTEVEVVDHDHIARSRLRIDARKWFAGKLKPKKYGDKVVNEIMGKDGGAVQVETKDVTDVEAARRIAFMLGKAVGKQQAAKNVEPA